MQIKNLTQWRLSSLSFPDLIGESVQDNAYFCFISLITVVPSAKITSATTSSPELTSSLHFGAGFSFVRGARLTLRRRSDNVTIYLILSPVSGDERIKSTSAPHALWNPPPVLKQAGIPDHYDFHFIQTSVIGAGSENPLYLHRQKTRFGKLS